MYEENQKFDLSLKKLSSNYERINISEMKNILKKLKMRNMHRKEDSVDLIKLRNDLELKK